MKFCSLFFCLLLSISQPSLADLREVSGVFDSLYFSDGGVSYPDSPLILNQGISPVYVQGQIDVEGGQLVGGYLQTEGFTIDVYINSGQVDTRYELSSARWVFNQNGTASFSADQSCVEDGFTICPVLPAAIMLSWGNISLDVIGNEVVVVAEATTLSPFGTYFTFTSKQVLTDTFLVSINSPVTNNDGCVEAQNPDGATVTLMTSSTGSSEQLQYLWTTSTGLSGTGSQLQLDIPLNGSVSVDLTAVETVSGEEASDTLTLCSSDTTAPEIYFLKPVDGEVLKKWDGPVKIKVVDAVDKNIELVEIYIAESRTINKKRSGLFSSKLSRPVQGESAKMKITADVVDASGNKTEASISVIQQTKATRKNK